MTINKSLMKVHADLLFLNLISLAILIFLIEELLYNGSILSLDNLIYQKISLLINPTLTQIMTLVTNIASKKIIFILSIIILFYFFYSKKWKNIILFSIAMSGGLIFELIFKGIFERTRPENALIPVSGYSFPSGHATIAIILFSLLIYFFKDEIKDEILKGLFILLNIIIILAIGFSRIYLGVHWFTDVLAGFTLGLFWLTLQIILKEFNEARIKTKH